MTVYLDTSSLVKLYVDEPGAEVVDDLVRDADVVAMSMLAYVEARATFARRRRERLLTPSEYRRVVAQFEEDWPRFVRIALSDADGREAGRLADAHGIRGGDAVHLAAFQTLLASSPDHDVRFCCADERLTRAARSLG